MFRKYPSKGHFYPPFLCKVKWSLRHININQGLSNVKEESVGFVQAVPKHTTKIDEKLSSCLGAISPSQHTTIPSTSQQNQVIYT